MCPGSTSSEAGEAAPPPFASSNGRSHRVANLRPSTSASTACSVTPDIHHCSRKRRRSRMSTSEYYGALLDFLLEEDEMYGMIEEAILQQIEEENQPPVPRRQMHTSVDFRGRLSWKTLHEIPVEEFRGRHSSGQAASIPTTSAPPHETHGEEDDVSYPQKKVGSSSGRKGRHQHIDDNFVKDFVASSRERMHLVQLLCRDMSAATPANVDGQYDIDKAQPVPTIKECVAVLKQINGLSRQMYIAALDLFTDPQNRSLFMSLEDVSDQFDWIYIHVS